MMGVTDPKDRQITDLQRDVNELRGALERLLHRPRCGRCKKAAEAVLKKIEPVLVKRVNPC